MLPHIILYITGHQYAKLMFDEILISPNIQGRKQIVYKRIIKSFEKALNKLHWTIFGNVYYKKSKWVSLLICWLILCVYWEKINLSKKKDFTFYIKLIKPMFIINVQKEIRNYFFYQH